ncbi:phospholipase [Pseudooceanicola sediminis]|uniref:Phospholipase D n=1 Tax=Pseudooceanicola sediminis TaxID=2211117 RepID=A0A399J6Q6_9RHOB|nr:phospholipase D family protein [Pseudooceanicola sediminis]KAA2314182.1 phospholipase [Puniceibacterium sp. HSS470]RII39959.1 phospholipase [Pseudooceanicola sediminis]|tara:strand:- start:11992 stop:13515 length:1524 start_codon:yes stop_codon:yes gene_type:complete
MPKDRSTTPRFQPLITASEMFPALERLCLNTKEELLMSFRIIDPMTRLRSTEAQDLGLKTWADLITHIAERGIKVRLLIADFDPLFTPDLHRGAWTNAQRFGHRMPKDTEILCALHECKSAPVWKRIFWPKIKNCIADLSNYAPSQLTPLQHQAMHGEVNLHPVTLHQKFAVSDGEAAIIGGIDVNERRWDDEKHDRRAEETWHDVSILIAGRVVGDLRRHFADSWERARNSGAASFGVEVTPVSDTKPLPSKLHSASGPRLLRTISCDPESPIRLGPRSKVTEHEEAHIAAFDSAKRLIYIETQFFRHMPLAKALARAAERAPELQVILVMPSEPDRLIFDGARGFDVRHAQALQLRCLRVLRRAFGDRLAILAPAQPRRAPDHTPMPLHGAGIIYLHSKVTLVDDHLGIVGSANLNGRSMRWDTEASLQFHGKRDITMIRERLMSTWLRGRKKTIDVRKASDWVRVAQETADLAPDAREAYILPWPEARNRRFARPIPILPAEMF